MKRPNIIFIMSDDHASNAISSYSGIINQTPNIDRIANEGIRMNRCFCTNAICTPSRAVILTGKYNHLNGVRTLNDSLDNTQENLAKILQRNGYQTGIVGKWHLGHGENNDPSGFDYWNILPGQGRYDNPTLIENGTEKVHEGYVTDIITDLSIDWLNNRDKEKPFFLMCHHKAPHFPWTPHEKYSKLYDDVDIPEPETLFDDYETRSDAAKMAVMQVKQHMKFLDKKATPPNDLSDKELTSWYYQLYIKDYLRVVASIDENVGKVLDYVDEQGLREDTIIVYTSDQGFFLGEHGWYDKRFMYEESLQMPLLIRYPREIAPGSSNDDIIVNIDFAPTFLDYANIPMPAHMQGESFRSIVRGDTVEDWREAMYYRYWMKESIHRIAAHYGIRTKDHKLICYYEPGILESDFLLGESEEDDKPDSLWPQWELFDLTKDAYEVNNVYYHPEYRLIREKLTKELYALKEYYKDYE